jgi:hypothetical protein
MISKARQLAALAHGLVRDQRLFCSFCFRSQHEVAKLISGHGGIFICDVCVAACNHWIAGMPPPNAERPSDSDLPTERLLQRLKAIDDTLRGKGSQLQWVVDQLRAREVSWVEIGKALGISRQSAWERFS